MREEHEEGQAQLEPGHSSLAGHRKDFGCDSESERGEAGGHDLMCVSHVSGQLYALNRYLLAIKRKKTQGKKPLY